MPEAPLSRRQILVHFASFSALGVAQPLPPTLPIGFRVEVPHSSEATAPAVVALLEGGRPVVLPLLE